MKVNQKPIFSFFILFVLIFSQFALPQPAYAATVVYYAVPGGSTSANCTSWATACELQRAIDQAKIYADSNSADTVQVWVQQGTYVPVSPVTADSREVTFTLKDKVSVYGGFLFNETIFNNRNSNPALTVLSGEIGVAGNSDNAYHVVTAIGLSNSTVLEGFTISNGNADGTTSFGGGILISGGASQFKNLVITNNRAISTGGGVYVNSFVPSGPESDYSRPVFTNVTISNNIAVAEGGGIFAYNSSLIMNNVNILGNTAQNSAGGGANFATLNATDEPSIPILTNVTFHGNTGKGGGGLFTHNSDARLTNVTFSSNTATRRGGGMFNEDSFPHLTNVTFYQNISQDGFADPRGGGGMMNLNSDPLLNNVTFSGNNSLVVGGDAIRNSTGSNPEITNSIFWGNVNDEITNDGTSNVTINDSLLKGGCPATTDFICTNIVNSDPLFLALDYYGGFTKSLALNSGSPAIDAGNAATPGSGNGACAATDQRGIPRPQPLGGVCDMGAYEYDAVPTITDRSPAPGSTGVAVNTNVTVTFSEPMNAATITGTTFTLRASGAGSDVPATVSYLNKVATLDPTSDLAPGTLYNVTVAGTVADLTGNTLGSNATWSFTTLSAGGSYTDTTSANFNAGTVGTCIVDGTGGGAVKLNIPTSTSCVFTSRIFDAGNLVDWVSISSTQTTPAGTSIVLEVNVGNADGSWTGWRSNQVPLNNFGGQYAQYRATLTTTDSAQTPVLEDVTLNYVNKAYAVLQSPIGAQTDWDHVFRWTGRASATNYLLEVYKPDNSFALWKWYTAAQAGCAGGTDCSITPTATLNLANGEYKWRVADYDTTDGYGIITNLSTFTLSGACYKLTTIASPGIGGNVTAGATNCDTGSGGGYTTGSTVQVTVAPNPGYVFTGWSGGGTSGTSLTTTVTMDADKSVTANLRGNTLISPSGTLTTWNNTFSWTGHAAATYYLLEVRKPDNTIVLYRWYTAAQAGCAGGTACSLSPTQLAGLANGDYKWYVRDYGAYGYGAYTPAMTFTLNQ